MKLAVPFPSGQVTKAQYQPSLSTFVKSCEAVELTGVSALPCGESYQSHARVYSNVSSQISALCKPRVPQRETNHRNSEDYSHQIHVGRKGAKMGIGRDLMFDFRFAQNCSTPATTQGGRQQCTYSCPWDRFPLHILSLSSRSDPIFRKSIFPPPPHNIVLQKGKKKFHHVPRKKSHCLCRCLSGVQ